MPEHRQPDGHRSHRQRRTRATTINSPSAGGIPEACREAAGLAGPRGAMVMAGAACYEPSCHPPDQEARPERLQDPATVAVFLCSGFRRCVACFGDAAEDFQSGYPVAVPAFDVVVGSRTCRGRRAVEPMVAGTCGTGRRPRDGRYRGSSTGNAGISCRCASGLAVVGDPRQLTSAAGTQPAATPVAGSGRSRVRSLRACLRPPAG